MRRPNPFAGEVAVELAGRSRVLRPDWAALIAIEQELGEPVVVLTYRFIAQRAGAREVEVVLRHCLAAAGEQVTDLPTAILQAGIGPLVDRLTDFLQGTLKGARTEADAEADGGNGTAPAVTTASTGGAGTGSRSVSSGSPRRKRGG